MASAREEILARIRGAGRPSPVAVPRDYERARTVPDPVGLLAERVADYQAVVHTVGEKALPGRIAGCLAERGASTMVVPADVPPSWRVEGVRWRPDDPPLQLSELDIVDGVLTGCAVAIAETGTIVLDAARAQGRRMLSLVPDYHLCVVRADQVVVSVPEALARLEPTRPLTFISGPSATSDIEFDRVEGVHGPRTLEVLIAR
ncbi:LutC/YkgG family protein [Prauserella muralis]|uniref:Lactate utilization protein C n=1 Tax=Prauserella muralis TaxID=588067 RepID=A0A2V4BL14_9PSEU|nr:LUD domain-containing protein [Prauserella muralis]PXY31323.1 lactate utilization protein C [Prauserella muralis]TWE14357.1 L-lactate dehydrogenase complex protein LldG [Prauserella muralis]